LDKRFQQAYHVSILKLKQREKLPDKILDPDFIYNFRLLLGFKNKRHRQVDIKGTISITD
jgi:hypothetical protein